MHVATSDGLSSLTVATPGVRRVFGALVVAAGLAGAVGVHQMCEKTADVGHLAAARTSQMKIANARPATPVATQAFAAAYGAVAGASLASMVGLTGLSFLQIRRNNQQKQNPRATP